jgi:hypothetical protein
MEDERLSSTVFREGDVINLITGSGNEDYGFAFASHLDWPLLGNSLMDDADLVMPDWNEFSISTGTIPTTDDHLASDLQNQNLSASTPPKTNVTQDLSQDIMNGTLAPEPEQRSNIPNQRQIEIYEQIDTLESDIQDLEFQDGNLREILALKLQKTQLRLELQQLREYASRDKKLVSILFEEATIQLEIMKLDNSAEELEENEDYLQLRLKKVYLKKELDALRQQAT